jgi:hypothetical protein
MKPLKVERVDLNPLWIFGSDAQGLGLEWFHRHARNRAAMSTPCVPSIFAFN